MAFRRCAMLLLAKVGVGDMVGVLVGRGVRWALRSWAVCA